VVTARALGAGALLLALSAMRAAAGTYFVDQAHPAASTSGPGTEASPYSTIASAVSARAAAGNTIIVKAGTYREQVSIPASGSALAPIVLRAQGTVIVDGADDFSSPALWSAGAGGDYLAASVTWSPKQVMVGGTRLTPAADSTSALLANTFRYVAGAGLYVNVAGANPGASTTYVGRRASAFVVSGRSWITIEGFTSLRADDRANNLSSGAADLEIVGNTVRYSAKYGMYLSDCHRVRVASNTLSDNGHHGLMLTNASSNCTIEDNEACRNAAPDVRVANGLHLYSATANVIRRNRWHDNQDSGQHMQSGSNDNVSSNNLSWNNGDHGFDHLAATGTLHPNDGLATYEGRFAIEGASTGTRLANRIATGNGLGARSSTCGWIPRR
jgi:parallel beta-helix repeat protein